MKRLLIAALLFSGCLHVKEADKGEPKEDETADAQAKTGSPKEGASKEGASKEGAPAAPVPAKSTTAKPAAAPAAVKPAAEEGRPELSVSPTGLLTEDGPRVIQQALENAGYLREHHTGKLDEETSGAIRKFQGDHEMAKTGVPDHETLHRLGIDPMKVLRSVKR